MAIFNSLGSNYNFRYVWQSLFSGNDEKNKKELITLLEKKYSGKAILVYKGREALRLALKIINKPKEFRVAICGYTCYAVYEAVVKEGYDVEYLDIDEQTLNFTFETLRHAVKKNSSIKVVIIQNTLGYPCEMEKIAKFCKENGIILIEDLAHSIGTRYKDGKEAGAVGDFAALSYSQDKMIDAVSGGALIIKNHEFRSKNQEYYINEFKSLPGKTKFVDRMYPSFTYKIRLTYGIGLGKGLHWGLKQLHLLSAPMNNLHNKVMHSLESWYCSLILHEFSYLYENLAHRKKIAGIYTKHLNKKILKEFICDTIQLSTNLRFPIFTENRQSLISYLKNYNIFISDIWYDAPVAPKKYMHLTNYSGQCPGAEKVSSLMVNLPTHRNVSEKSAKYIAEKVNEWLDIQKQESSIKN